MSKTIWSDAEAQLRPIMSNGLIDLPSNSKFSVKDLNYNFDKIINVNNAINNLNEINEHMANTHIHITAYSENSDIGKILMINDSGKAVWAEPPQSGTAVQILTWEATD